MKLKCCFFLAISVLSAFLAISCIPQQPLSTEAGPKAQGFEVVPPAQIQQGADGERPTGQQMQSPPPAQANPISPPESFSCPDEMRLRQGLQTLAITNGVARPLGKDEQDWITQNCPSTQGTKGNGWTYNQPVTSKLPSCVGNTLLTDSPIDVSLVKRLIPLGHIGTPHHAVPMDHMEYVLPQVSSEGTSDAIKTDIKAPGAVHIIGVRQTIKKVNGVIVDDKYFSIAFTPCKEVLFYFEAMGTISDALKQAIEEAKNTELIEGDAGATGSILKQYRIDYVTKPGEVIGTAGGPEYPGRTLDWGAYDTRIPKLGFLGDQIPDPRTAYTTCPIDYFPSSLRDRLYAKFDRNVPPLCGEVMQDLAGTIQGNWKAQGQPDSFGDLILMGIVHDNLDPSVGIIAVAGVLTSHGAIDFTPQPDGFINREPSEVKADGNVYCYQSGTHRPVSSAPVIPGRILLQLVNDGTLKAEHQEKSCSENFSFNSPTIYQR